MAKSPDAFRTISEVAAWLGVQAHVLRFWESKFTQVKPVKRAGGRRYYRPADMRLIGGIKVLLHDEGMTIKGVQKVLREQGVAHVSALAPPLDGEAGDMPVPAAASVPAEKGGTVLAFKAKAEPAEKPGAAEKPAEKPAEQPAATARATGEETASTSASLPSFLNTKPEKTSQPPAPAPRPAASAAPVEPEPPYTPGALGHLAGLTTLTARQAAEIAPLTRALRAWYERSEKAGLG